MREDTPSSTALLIARATWLLSQEPQYAAIVPAGAPEICSWFVEASDRSDRFLRLCQHPWFRRVIYAIEQSVLPGILVHYLLRKCILEETVRRAISEGCQQVVILGAGFDPLALRLQSEYPAVHFLEIDHPATQNIKRAVLKAKGRLTSHVTLLPHDLGQPHLEQMLSQSPDFRPQAPTVFIAEGLLMYLPSDQIATLFQAIHRLSGPRSRFAFTFLALQLNGDIDFEHSSHIIHWWLKRRHEPFRWGVRLAALPEFLKSLGFAVDSTYTADALRHRYLLPETPTTKINGDLVCVAVPLT